MQATIQKWGNSAALRFTTGTLDAAGFRLDQSVEIRAESGRIVIEPAEPVYDLDALVAQITPENLHPLVDTDAPVGMEQW